MSAGRRRPCPGCRAARAHMSCGATDRHGVERAAGAIICPISRSSASMQQVGLCAPDYEQSAVPAVRVILGVNKSIVTAPPATCTARRLMAPDRQGAGERAACTGINSGFGSLWSRPENLYPRLRDQVGVGKRRPFPPRPAACRPPPPPPLPSPPPSTHPPPCRSRPGDGAPTMRCTPTAPC